jgi:aspartyl-tRNA(Asn)/glutamyl-tRNA(Gln) amidotransferase subunit A
LEQADPPGGDPSHAFHDLWWAGAGFLLGQYPPDRKAQMDPGLRAMVEEGAAISLRRFQEATQARGAYASAMRVFMCDYDFLLTPTLPLPAFDVGIVSPWPDDGFAWLGWTPFSLPFNQTQQPAASVPCGFTRTGLPVGLQIVGRLYDDAGVLAAAAAYEAADPHYDKAPEGFA